MPHADLTLPVDTAPAAADGSALLHHYWHPQRAGVEQAPADFARRLAEIHSDLRMVRPPARAPLASRPWLCWQQRPHITARVCPGWMLLFCWQERHVATQPGELDTFTPLPLDDRVFANLYRIDPRRHASALAYFDSIHAKLTREQAAIADAKKDEAHAFGRDYAQFRRIKNIGKGNKAALFHDGTVVAGRAERAWVRSLSLLPGDVSPSGGR